MKLSVRIGFLSFFSLILATAWFTSFAVLIWPLNLSQPFLILILSIYAFSFFLQIHRFYKFRKGPENKKAVLFTFILLGFFIHLFCAAVTKALLGLFVNLEPYEPFISLAFIVLSVVFNILGMRTALKGPVIKQTEIKWPQQFTHLGELNLVQISDLHVGPIINKKYVSRVASLTAQLDPDIVCYTGDIGDGDAETYGPELEPLKNIKSKLGSFYISGNHEHMWGFPAWSKQMSNLGIKTLFNNGEQILPELFIGGVPDISSRTFEASESSDPSRAIQNALGYKILLAHQPKSCFAAESAGFDLMLSGHTHNGQFFPFNLLVGFFNPYSKGLNLHGKMKVYVNQGTGFWGPPLRLGVESEITLIKFR